MCPVLPSELKAAGSWDGSSALWCFVAQLSCIDQKNSFPSTMQETLCFKNTPDTFFFNATNNRVSIISIHGWEGHLVSIAVLSPLTCSNKEKILIKALSVGIDLERKINSAARWKTRISGSAFKGLGVYKQSGAGSWCPYPTPASFSVGQ